MAQYHVNMAEMSVELVRLRPEAQLEEGAPAALLQGIRDQAAVLLRAAGEPSGERGDVDMARLSEQFQASYQQFKSAVLHAGSAGKVAPRRMAAVLEYGSALRRTCSQACKAAMWLDRYLAAGGHGGAEARESADVTAT